MARRRDQHDGMQQDATPCNNHPFRGPPLDYFLSRPKGLSERQRNAVELLLQGLGDQDVAAQVGVDRTTIFRWRRQVAFIRELHRQRQLRAERAANQMQSMVPAALKILQEQLDSSDTRQRMRAVSILLRFATPGRLGANTAAAASAAAAATPLNTAPLSRDQVPNLEDQQRLNDLIAFIEAPLPGEPGAAEDEEEDEDDGEGEAVKQ